MSKIKDFLLATRGGDKLHWTDWFSRFYLLFGILLMFGPVVWLTASSFKTKAALVSFPPTFFPLAQVEVEVDGNKKPLPLFDVTMEDGSIQRLAQKRRIGKIAQMLDPAKPDEILKLPIDNREPVREIEFAWENYTDPFTRLQRYNFPRYLLNSVVVTVVATIITLLINSMAAFALSIYEFRGRNLTMLFVICILFFPVTVILVPTYLVITELGMLNSLWGVILPGAATPTGVFLLRQYMLTIPRDVIEAARMDKASEWAIYARIVLPLSLPALSVLAIFSIMWRWNDFLLPLVVLTKSEVFTLQIGLNAFQGELEVQWNYLLAMTVIAILPVATVFIFLQRFITTGISTTGMK